MASSNESDCVCEIRVEPVFGTNQELKEEILNELNFRLLTEMNQEAMPLRRPKILVFRPTGRSGDEFQKKLATVLTGDSVYYLIMAYTAKPGKMIEIPSDYQEKIKEFTTQLVISGGKLVPYDNENYKFNKKSFLKLAEEICRAFPHVKMRQNTKRKRILYGIIAVLSAVFGVCINKGFQFVANFPLNMTMYVIEYLYYQGNDTFLEY